MNNICRTLGVCITVVLFGGNSYAGLDDILKGATQKYLPGDNTASSTASALPDGQVNAGLKEALTVGAERAVEFLGKPGGFLENPSVRIPLPGSLEKAGSAARAIGQGAIVDEFETTVNRAAEEAIPQTLEIVTTTVQNMTMQDVQGILAGGDDAATQYLRKNSWDSMHKAVLPIVSKATDQTGATAAYKSLVSSSSGALGSLGGFLGASQDELDLDKYATDKTLDGLFTILAEEERKIRENPLARSTDLLKTVFQ